MNTKYIDTTKVGNIDFDNIIPALDKKAGNNELRPVLNIADPAMLVESAFDRFYETTATVKPNPIALTPIVEGDKTITYVLNATQIGHVQSKVAQQAAPGNGNWFSRQNLADSPWGNDSFWIGGQGLDWSAVLDDFSYMGTDYKGLLNICGKALDYGTIAPGMPLVQIDGNAEADKGIRAMYYAMAKMKTRFFNWGFDVESTTYDHTNQNVPLAEEGHLYSWATNKTPTSYIADVCTPASTPLHKLFGAIRADAFDNIQALMTFETRTAVTYTRQGQTYQFVLFHTYNEIQSNGVEFRFDIGESAIFPPLLQPERVKQEVIGGTGGQTISHALNTELSNTGWGTVSEDWSEPVDPSKLTPSSATVIGLSMTVDLTNCYVIADKQLHTDLEQYYN